MFLTEFDNELRKAEADYEYHEDGSVARVTGVLWGGRKSKVYDEETGNEVKVPYLDADGNPELLKSGAPKMKNLLAGENYWFFRRMGPTWVKRAAAVLRNDAENGMSIIETGIERKVSAWLDGPGSILVVGYIDSMVLVDENGEVIVRDWKTGSFTQEIQLANYAWLLANLEDPVNRAYATKGQFVKLRSTKKEDWVKEYDLTKLVPLVAPMFREMVEAMKPRWEPNEDGEFVQVDPVYIQHPSSFCTSCWVRQYCSYGVTLPEPEDAS